MAFTQQRQTDSYKASVALGQYVPVALDSKVNCVVLATVGAQPIGLTDASVAAGENVTVNENSSVAKAIAAASTGPNTLVGVASTNGSLGPVAAASGTTKWAVGVSRTPALAGEKLSVYVNPQQLSNLA